jgi:hypothetical protein
MDLEMTQLTEAAEWIARYDSTMGLSLQLVAALKSRCDGAADNF